MTILSEFNLKISQILTFSTFCHQGSVFSWRRAELMMLLQMKSHKIGPTGRHSSSPAKIPTQDDNSFRQNSIWEFGVRRMKQPWRTKTNWKDNKMTSDRFHFPLKTLSVSILRVLERSSFILWWEWRASVQISSQAAMRWPACVIRHAPSQRGESGEIICKFIVSQRGQKLWQSKGREFVFSVCRKCYLDLQPPLAVTAVVSVCDMFLLQWIVPGDSYLQGS